MPDYQTTLFYLSIFLASVAITVSSINLAT